ncbi:MAG: RNA 2',3'-cyclic phosphodiesterase [Burkholderiales bacterium]
MAVDPRVARVFFAVWPPPEVQGTLSDVAQQAQGECGGRAVAADNIHLTLVFIGDVSRDRLARLEALGATVAAPRFSLLVDRLEYWRHNRILWAGVRECPQALRTLVERLQESVAAARFRIERRPYVPHVTLRRDARGAPANTRIRVDWPVTEFALVESAQRARGRVYDVLRRWTLAA